MRLRLVSCPFELFSFAHVTKFDLVRLCQKDVLRLYVTVNYLDSVQALYCSCNLAKKSPDSEFRQKFSVLLLYEVIQVTIFAKFHKNDELLMLFETGLAKHNIWMFELLHELSFHERVLLLLIGHIAQIELF